MAATTQRRRTSTERGNAPPPSAEGWSLRRVAGTGAILLLLLLLQLHQQLPMASSSFVSSLSFVAACLRYSPTAVSMEQPFPVGRRPSSWHHATRELRRIPVPTSRRSRIGVVNGDGEATNAAAVEIVSSLSSLSSSSVPVSSTSKTTAARTIPWSASSSSSSTATFDDAAATPVCRSSSSSSSFTTPKTQVYIEDTDAYGVMYNANYLRAYDRALHTATTGRTTSMLWHNTNNNHDGSGIQPDKDNNNGTAPPTLMMILIQSVAKMRYKASPALGSTYVISGTRRCGGSSSSDRCNSSSSSMVEDKNAAGAFSVETWDLEMTSEDGSSIASSSSSNETSMERISYNPEAKTITAATTTTPPPTDSATSIEKNAIDEVTVASKRSTDSFPIHRDELDTIFHGSLSLPRMTPPPTTDHHHHQQQNPSSYLPLFRVLNLMERARSNLLGGPDALRRLQEEHGILTVITGFTDLKLLWPTFVPLSATTAQPTDGDTNHQPVRFFLPVVVPGKTRVAMDTDTIWKRRGTVLECIQTAYYITDGSDYGSESYKVPVARGIASLLAIDAVTKRPVRQLPDWVEAMVLNGESDENE